MRKPGRSEAERYFTRSQKKNDDKIVKQKQKTERDRDGRMARLRDLRLAKEADGAAEPIAAETPAAAEQPEPAASAEQTPMRLPRVHPHQS